MFSYHKRLQYPVNIKKKDLRMAKYLVTQYGGANGELGAALRYLNQRMTMPDDKGKALLNDIGTEELGHVEMLETMIYQLMKDATLEEIKEAGLDTHYAEHAKGLFPTDSNGVPFTAAYFATTGDPLADISEDMAAFRRIGASITLANPFLFFFPDCPSGGGSPIFLQLTHSSEFFILCYNIIR